MIILLLTPYNTDFVTTCVYGESMLIKLTREWMNCQYTKASVICINMDDNAIIFLSYYWERPNLKLILEYLRFTIDSNAKCINV